MLIGKIVGKTGGKYTLELQDRESFCVSARDLPEHSRRLGAEVMLTLSQLGALVEPQQVRDVVNYLLGVQ